MRILKKAAAAAMAVAVAACAVAFVVPVQSAQAADGLSVTVTRAATGKVTVKKGTSYKLAAKATAGSKVTYKSSKKSVVTVSKSGVLKAKKTGKATVTVTAAKDGAKVVKKVKVTVVTKAKYKALTRLSVRTENATIAIGATTKVKVSFPNGGSNKNVVFKSSDTSVATVSPTGVVTAKKPGTAKISATACAGGLKASVTVTVKAPSHEHHYVWKSTYGTNADGTRTYKCECGDTITQMP